MTALHGALAASITPLRDHGSALDDDAFGPLVDFFVSSGLDGILALGTAGEGILLRVEERRSAADLFLQASDKRLQVAVHCGAQTTVDTVTLAAHAAEVGADAVVVIGPPYFKLDEKAQYGHFFAAATWRSLPFYVYEFAATTRYSVAPAVLERLRDSASNVVRSQGLGYAVGPFCEYVLPGLDIFVGPESLIADGMAPRCTGCRLPTCVCASARGCRGRSRPDAGGRGPPRRAPCVRRALPAAGSARRAGAAGSSWGRRMSAHPFARSRSRNAPSLTPGTSRCSAVDVQSG